MVDTTTSAIPTLSEDQIRERVGQQSFQRGKEYFRSKAIFDTRRQGMTLKARSRGSQGQTYRLGVTFDAKGIVNANCSCPVGDGGYCKHTAALLLTWRERPQDFSPVEETDTALEQRSKEELIALIKQMLRRQPELESLLEVPLPTGSGSSATVDPAIYRSQAAEVFSFEDYDWEAPRDVADELLAIKEIGDGFVRQGDFENAAAVFEAVLLETLEHFESFYDESGDMHEVVSECVAGLGACLTSQEDRAARERILHDLFEVYRQDIKIGGVSLSDEAVELILDDATPEERRTAAGWVRDAMPKAGSSWAREAFGGFLLDLEMDDLDDEEFLQVCRDTGRLGDLVDRLLTLGRADEAAAATGEASDYTLLSLANIFVRHGLGDTAEQLVLQRAQHSEDLRLHEWLKTRYRAQDDLAPALELAEKIFRDRPTLQGYSEMRELARKLRRWDAMRPEILAFLGEARWNDLLISIYLDEGEIDRALEALHASGSRILSYGYGLYGGPSLATRVAQAAEGPRPQAAREIYQKQVEQLIQGRNRNYYREAAQLLVKVRRLYERLNERDAWSTYIANLRERYRTLRALKEELAAAGL